MQKEKDLKQEQDLELDQEQKIIVDKNGIRVIKLDTNKFTLSFNMINNNIVLPAIINFDLINLLNKLNPNIFESMRLNRVSDKNAIMDLLLKDLFSDLGIPHYYLALNINIENEYDAQLNINKIIFNCISFNNKLDLYPIDVELLPTYNINMCFNIINNHHVYANCDIGLIDKHNTPSFFEKIVGNIFYNIFYKLKQFIENVSF